MVKEVASGGGGESGLTSSLASYYVVKEVYGATQQAHPSLTLMIQRSLPSWAVLRHSL